MIDLSQAKRSEVLKLQFGYNDYLLFRQCLHTVYQRKDKLHSETVANLSRNISDIEILLETMRKEGSVE